MHSDVVKHVLFCGTKIVRARRPQDDGDGEAAAIALVIRTGFNTTKGALVRSMLFPKPSGFKFYRDSFRYISVMAIVALMGFVASFINFIKLGVRNFQNQTAVMLTLATACLAFNSSSRTGLDYHCSASSASGNLDYWHQLRFVTAAKKADILYQPTKVAMSSHAPNMTDLTAE